MTLSDLLDEIYAAPDTSVGIRRTKAKHGNKGEAGDYEIIDIEMKGKVFIFEKNESGWEKCS